MGSHSTVSRPEDGITAAAAEDGASSSTGRSRTTSEEGSFTSTSTASSSSHHHHHHHTHRPWWQHFPRPRRSRNNTHADSNGVSSIAECANTRQVFLYSQNEYETIEVADNETVESVCHRLCKLLQIKPVVELLFALRNAEDKNHKYFLPACRSICAYKGPFEFRLRYKLPANSTKLNAMDKNAFEYFYMQVRHDLVDVDFPEISYVKENDKILGLAVTAMYLRMVKNGTPPEELMRNYKEYTPKPNQRFAKNKIRTTLEGVVKTDYNPYYIMESYLSQINDIGPFYLKEEYEAATDYVEDSLATTSSNIGSNPSIASGISRRELVPRNVLLPVGTRTTSCALKVELLPEYMKEAVLKVHYKHTHSNRVYPIKGMNVIMIDDGLKVHIEWSDRTQLNLVMKNVAEAESLVSGLATYYRLMDRWTFDLCSTLCSPSLVHLTEIKCHGPIGFAAAYEKLQSSAVGYYILRQCDQTHDTYNLDIKTSAKEVRTFKITQAEEGGWFLHLAEGEPQKFNDLTEIARSVPGPGNRMRIGPSSLPGGLPSLLLCQKQGEVRKVQTTGDIIQGGPRCINPKELLRKETLLAGDANSTVTEILADWMIDNKTFVEVTLKALKQGPKYRDNVMPFLNLAQKWAQLNSRDILRIYGMTMYDPTAMVMERSKCNLVELLRKQRPNRRLLIDVAASLSRALNYLHNQNFVHARIRCSSLHVIAYDEDTLSVRLGDPGINSVFTEADLPWIPWEYHAGGKMKLSKFDLSTDIWAFATTVWQIFSHGATPPKDCFKYENRDLPRPEECPGELYAYMKMGWNRDVDKRFDPQQLHNCMYRIRQEADHYYETPSGPKLLKPPAASSSANGSVSSIPTDRLDLISENGTLTNGDTSPTNFSAGWSYCARTESTLVPDDGYSISSGYNIGRKLESSKYEVVIQQQIGSGHYGTVHQGEMWFKDRPESVPSFRVAVKMIKPMNSSLSDIQQESKIMKALKHPNILKILDFHCEIDVAIIMEFMPKGNLGSFISANSYRLTEEHRLRFARDIACGMEYLQLKDIVHRDLAVRNVLVAEDETLKISDFGLARFVDTTGYYLLQDMDKGLPIHYYAPETLEYSRYSVKSDVWSYGITLFEIFKRDEEKPILVKGDAQQLIKALSSGMRLPRSDTCPQAVYDQLMMPCWEYEKERRPTFTLILKMIDNISMEYGERI